MLFFVTCTPKYENHDVPEGGDHPFCTAQQSGVGLKTFGFVLCNIRAPNKLLWSTKHRVRTFLCSNHSVKRYFLKFNSQSMYLQAEKQLVTLKRNELKSYKFFKVINDKCFRLYQTIFPWRVINWLNSEMRKVWRGACPIGEGKKINLLWVTDGNF